MSVLKVACFLPLIDRNRVMASTMNGSAYIDNSRLMMLTISDRYRLTFCDRIP